MFTNFLFLNERIEMKIKLPVTERQPGFHVFAVIRGQGPPVPPLTAPLQRHGFRLGAPPPIN